MALPSRVPSVSEKAAEGLRCSSDGRRATRIMGLGMERKTGVGTRNIHLGEAKNPSGYSGTLADQLSASRRQASRSAASRSFSRLPYQQRDDRGPPLCSWTLSVRFEIVHGPLNPPRDRPAPSKRSSTARSSRRRSRDGRSRSDDR